MNNNTLKTIITAAVLVILFAVAISIVSSLIKVLLPIAIVVVAGYIIYKLVTGK